jgi:toxin ParE1/3/4
MPRLIWSRGSVDDLVRIKAFLDQHDPRAALRIVEAMRTSADLLAAYPCAGPVLSDQSRNFSVRRTPYILVYRILGDAVEVARVRHARENWRTE